MPLVWFMSISMVMFLVMVLVDLFFYKSYSEMFNENFELGFCNKVLYLW